ncbi:MAG: glycosyl transferase family 25 [Dinoroseobacter sp.]|jgi:glycosyl transferase family 25
MNNISNSPLLEYFERIEIVHVPSRVDRYHKLVKELQHIGIDIDDSRVSIQHGFCADSADGYSSPQVRGGLLSHLSVLQRALKDDCRRVLILEDDAIFRTSLRDFSAQRKLIEQIKNCAWDILFLGHPISNQIKNQPKGIIETSTLFNWAHCYAVNQSVLPDLVKYLQASDLRPAGHTDGGKMYIDGGLNMFRARSGDVCSAISNPALSVQRGSPSGIANHRWYEAYSFISFFSDAARNVRDELWRRTGFFGTK